MAQNNEGSSPSKRSNPNPKQELIHHTYNKNVSLFKTMKFLVSAAIAVLLLITIIAAAAAKVEVPTSSNRHHGVLDKRKLLRQAIPVDRNGNRRREEEFLEIITHHHHHHDAHSILKFSHCLSLTMTQPKDNDDDDNIMFNNDKVESYVLFNIYKTENHDYDEEKTDENLYMVELAAYMDALVEEFNPDDSINKHYYCNACKEAMNYCL